MNTSDAILTGIASALAQASPGRSVTRSYREFSDRLQEALLSGVWTVLARGMREDLGEAQLSLLLIGQLTVEEGTDPLEVERAELAMMDEVLCLISGIRGVALRLGGMRQSMQIEAPDGWIAADLEAGPFSLNQAAPVITFDGE